MSPVTTVAPCCAFVTLVLYILICMTIDSDKIVKSTSLIMKEGDSVRAEPGWWTNFREEEGGMESGA